MNQIGKQRDIIDRLAVTTRLDDSLGGAAYSPAARAGVLDILKRALKQGAGEIRRRFEAGAHGPEVLRANAFLIDQLVRIIFDFAQGHVYRIANPTRAEELGVVAIGGYGRAELAPHSDIDLMFLLAYKQTAHGEQIVEYILYMLWDMGLKVGHATRSVDDCIRLARDDYTIRTSLLDGRWIWGDQELFLDFERRFQAEIVAGSGPQFVEAKLAERDRRHDRMGDTRYVVEPNIKEGKGGLRDLQTLYWLAKYLYRVGDVDGLVAAGLFSAQDARRYNKACDFLWTVRCHLHYLTGRGEERLTFDVQAAIGARMGYQDRARLRGVERFMKYYFLVAKDVGDLTRVICAVLEEQNKKRRPLFRLPGLPRRRPVIEGFVVDGERINVAADDAFDADPVKLIRLFHAAHENDLDIHPEALRQVTAKLKLIDRGLRGDAEANRLFLDLLTAKRDPEIALRRLNESGVFGRFIPDFGRIVAQMQYDMYHTYTVDEHTIRAIGILNRIETGALAAEVPVATEIIHQISARRALYIATLIHDIAKGRGGDHSVLGAEIALKLSPRLGLSVEETETVSWLVRHHLLMSDTAFKRDMDDPKTIGDFVATVQSMERLKLLLVLTVADIRAVGPTVWNGWKAGLLRNLYYLTLEFMAGDQVADRRGPRINAAKANLRARLTDWSAGEIDTHLARGYPGYWLTFDTDTHVRHAGIIRGAVARGLGLHIETQVDEAHDVTEIIVYAADHPGLFSKIAGAMALAGASIVDAKIVTLADGMALDIFSIQDPQRRAFAEPARLQKLRTRIEDSLSGKISPAMELKRQSQKHRAGRTGVFTVAPRVIINNTASTTHTVIEINGRDRPGFLHDVTAALTALGLQISSAHISTYGERVVDVFYVKDVFGLKVEHESKLKAAHDRLLEAVGDEGGIVEAAAE